MADRGNELVEDLVGHARLLHLREQELRTLAIADDAGVRGRLHTRGRLHAKVDVPDTSSTAIVVATSPCPVVTIQPASPARTALANPIAHRGKFAPSPTKSTTSFGRASIVTVCVSLRIGQSSLGGTIPPVRLDSILDAAVTKILRTARTAHNVRPPEVGVSGTLAW